MKKIIRLTALALAIVMLLPCMASAAHEETYAPYSNAYIKSLTAGLSKSGDTLYVTFTTKGTAPMTSIGASCVKIYTADDTLVKTFWSAYNPSMLGSNCSFYTHTLSYDGTDGTTYYAVVTGYASYGGGSGTETYTTQTLTL